jgi:hypothetical protein
MTSVSKHILLSILVLSPVFLVAQSFEIDSSKRAIDVTGDFNNAEIHLPAVSTKPEFPGGKKAWHDFLRSNINIAVPFKNRAVPGIYRVVVWFIIGSDGKIRASGADSNSGFGMEAEVLRCINKTVEWKPAETGSGKKVSYTLRTMVVFTIKTNDVVINFL